MVRRHNKKIKNLEDFLNYEIDLSKIDFNKEVFTLDDVLGMEIDFGKLISTIALFVVVSFVPAISYGISEAYITQDLGFIEKDSQLLANDVYVSNIISAFRASRAEAQVATGTTTQSTILDKESYVWGETVTISIRSLSTSTVTLRLEDLKGKFVTNIATSTRLVPGTNVFKYNIPALGPNSTQDIFTLKVMNLNNSVVSSSPKFEVLKSDISVVLKNHRAEITGSGDLNSDIGRFKTELYVYSYVSDIYVSLPKTASGISIVSSNNASSTHSKIVSAETLNDLPNGRVKIPKGSYMLLILESAVTPVNQSGDFRQKINSITYSLTENGPEKIWTLGLQDVKTNSIILMYRPSIQASVEPVVDVINSSAIVFSDSVNSDRGEYSFRVRVSAPQSDIYIERGSTRVSVTDTTVGNKRGILWSSTTNSSVREKEFSNVLYSADIGNSKDTSQAFFIPKGQSRDFGFVTSIVPFSTGSYGVQINGIKWSTTTAFASNWNKYPNIKKINNLKSNMLILMSR